MKTANYLLLLTAILIGSGCTGEDTGAKLIKEREERRAKVAAKFPTILEKFKKLDLKTLKTVKGFKDRKRPVLLLTPKREVSMDHVNIKDPKGQLYAKTEKDVGLVIVPILRRNKKPDLEYEGGGKGYHTTAYLFAVAYPEMVIIASHKKVFKASDSTFGTTTTIAGSSVTNSYNQYGIVSDKYYRWFILQIHGITKASIAKAQAKAKEKAAKEKSNEKSKEEASKAKEK